MKVTILIATTFLYLAPTITHAFCFQGTCDWAEAPGTRSFSITLKQNEERIHGRCCAIAQSGARIDCEVDDLDNIHGEIDASGRAAILDFASFFDAQRGRATLKAADEKVLWTVEIEPIGGDYFATRNAILQRRPVVSPGNECRFN